MQNPGPPLQHLLRFLTECPPDFLEEPAIGSNGVIQVAAVVSDLLQELGGPPLHATEIAILSPTRPEERNRLRLILISSWLLSAPPLEEIPRLDSQARQFLLYGLDALATRIAADKFLTDPERREELVRLMLKALRLRPQGETIPQAVDRLQAIDTVERQRVLDDSKRVQDALERRKEELKAKAAAEAAAKISRE